jgi:regulator of RNase E activity RraB
MRFWLIVMLALLLGLLPSCAIGQTADPDQIVIEQLGKAGSDLSKPHRIEFFLYFPDSKGAARTMAALYEKKFDVDLSRPKKEGEKWLCKANKMMVPELKALQKIRKDFTAIAAANGGEYDGWGTAVVK